MPFDLRALNPTTRFYWDDNATLSDSEREWVDLRVVPDAELNKIRNAVGVTSKPKFIVNPMTKRMERVDDIDLSTEKITAINEKIYDYQIANWNLLSTDGNQIQCTYDNKLLMIYGSPSFANWLNKNLEKLAIGINELEKEEMGN